MAYISATLPGVMRGPHEHVHQTDGFALMGPSDFRLFLWDIRPDSPTGAAVAGSPTSGRRSAAVSIPPGVVHAYRNIGDVTGIVFDAPNRLYAGWGKLASALTPATKRATPTASRRTESRPRKGRWPYS